MTDDTVTAKLAEWEADMDRRVPAADTEDRNIARALLGFVREVREVHVRKHAVFSWQSGLRYEDPCPTCDGKAGVHECGCWADSDIEYVCEGCEQARPKRQPAPWPCRIEQAAQKWIGGEG